MPTDAEASSTPSSTPVKPTPITARAVMLGLIGAVQACMLQVVTKVSPHNVMLPYQSALTLLTGAIFWLFLMAMLNVFLRRYLPRHALRPSEFAVIYGLTTVAAAIGAQDQLMQLFPMFVFPFRASQDLEMGRYRPFIPHWLVPQDPSVVEPYYYGVTNFWQLHLLKAWILPISAWMLWLTALGVTLWAWNVILRHRWMDSDRLAFPSIQLPLEMCKEAGFGGAVSGKLFWTGFSITAIIVSLDQIHNRFPAVPSVPLGFIANPLLDALPAPWKALSPMTLTWDPIHLGISYFIPMDILFSGWFFYLLRKLEEVFGYSMGWRELGWDAAGFPYTRSQAAGAWMALFFLLVWAERKQFERVLRAAFSRRTIMDDSKEPASYTTAARCFVVGMLFLYGFSVYSGMSWWLALIFYIFFWMLNVTMTRLYAQVGPPILELYFLDPQATITRAIGTVGHQPGSLTMFSLMYWYNRTDRGHPMAHQLSTFKIAQATNTDMRGIGKWVLVAFVVGCVTCMLTALHWAYRVGEDQWQEGGWKEAFSPLAVSRIQQWVTTPKGPVWSEVGGMLTGGIVALTLAKISYTFLGFPFHPIGYALSVCYTMEYNWPAYMGIWVVKGFILRYGGRSLYFRSVPLFLGLILGGLVAPVLWGFVGYVFRWYI